MMSSMMTMDRRSLLKGSGALVFTLAGGGLNILTLSPALAAAPAARALAPADLDTWLAVTETGDVTAFFGKMDMGQGVDTAIAQVVAEELDVDVDRVSVVMGDTGLTPNQGGASGSSGCRLGANPLRNAAAEARRVFLARAAEHLGQPAEALSVSSGRVFVTAEPAKAVSYGEMIARGFDTALDWNQQYGNSLMVTGKASPKSPLTYSVVGAPVPRKDIPGKILATMDYCHHVSLPGMLHGRGVRPPVANAVPVAVDEKSISHIPGAQVVRKGDYVAVVAQEEWSAIKGAQHLKVTWSETEPPFPGHERLHDHIRQAEKVADNSVANFGKYAAYDTGPALAAIEASATRLEADYKLPFQSHARMAPSVGLADVQADSATIWSDTQKSHNQRDGLATLLGMAPEKVRVVWKPGPGSYGRSDADEAAFEAALLSQELGRPVRVQWMRHEGHGWDPKAPAAVISCKAGLDADGKLTGWFFRAKGFSGWEVMFNASDPRDTLVGQLTGREPGKGQNFGVPGESYAFPNAVKFWETIAPLQERASPLRCAHMRAPQEPQLHFASESFIDEVAAAAGADPIEFRLQYLTDAREIAVLEEVRDLAKWDSRPSPALRWKGKLVGRGVSLNSGFGAYVATVCEVEVDEETGRVWPRRVFVAHDCGVVINPRSLRTTIEGNVMQGLSRTLFEEVTFDDKAVTSTDWLGYPILDVMDAPDTIEIATINRVEEPPGGAGEPAHVTIPAAIANAIFDATGIRLRRLPLTPDRVKAGLV
jgi:CO/xanthine dehydrogenase Mo-binding subunit